MSRNRAAQVIAMVGASVLAAGCTRADADRSGADVSATELVLASSDPDLDGAPAVARFVSQVEQLSGGRLTVRVEGGAGSEQAVIEGVGEGQAHLGWAGTRAFDTVGVTTFQPLHAPFLVSSYAAQAAVVRDELTGDLLADLEPLGLTGLGITADQLRMPAAAAGPLLAREDFTGLVVRTVASEIQVQGLQALGGEPTTAGHAVDEEGVDAVETMWWTYQANHQYEYVPFVTHNVVLWPRTVVLFAHTGALQDLGDEARGWITDAAAYAVAWSAEHADDAVAGHIDTACEGATRIATATEDQLAQLRAAAEPVYEALREDGSLATILSRIERIVDDLPEDEPPDVPDGCAYVPGDEDRVLQPTEPVDGPGASGLLPEGVYRYAVSVEELQDAGYSRADAENNAGVFTWTLVGGKWTYEQEPEVPDAVAFTTCAGTYDVRDDSATFATGTVVTGGDCAPPSWIARFTVDGDSLSWTGVSAPGFELVFAPEPWERIG
jgi:TRAP-type C4-dicarboxylate transport system substrate-binding protein